MNSFFLRIYLSALAFLLVAFFVILYVANNLIFKDLLGDSSQKIYQTISQSLAHKDKNSWQSEIKTYNALVTDHTLSLITLDDLSKADKQSLNESKSGSVISDSMIGRADLYALYTLSGSKWILKIDEDDDSGDDLADTADTIILFLLLMLPLAFALYFLVRKLTKPIQHLTTVAKKLGQGDLTARADNMLLPPMNTLATGFNTMADQLNETLQEQQILVGAIPHELRSPLGRIRFALDMTRNHKTVEALHQDIEKLDGYVDEMENTVDEILELNRLQSQSQTTPITTASFDLCNLLHVLTEQQNHETTKVRIEIDCDKSFKVSGNAALINRAISNVLSNAQQYANSKISIKVTQNNGNTIVSIDDDGMGIADEKLDQVFAPFSTLDNSRNRKTGGIGLGLAIVKLIMKKHQGVATVSRSELGGARFELRW